MNSIIKVHPLTHNPTLAWDLLTKEGNISLKLNTKFPSTKPNPGELRCVCMSDTHSREPKFPFDIPNGDIFLHAGDFTNCGDKNEVKKFNNWIGTLPHKYKVVIAGNHELSFDRSQANGAKYIDAKSLITNATYLQDEEVVIEGIKIYGTPWQPVFGYWAFNLTRGQACLEKWNLIPDDTDILLTHGPPIGHGDLCSRGVRAGCVELLSTIQERVKPKYHIFGHIHEGYGITHNRQTIFINASTCSVRYNAVNPPIVFDIKLPQS